MVYVTDEQIAQYKRDGYLIVPSFLSDEESAAALEGFYDNVRLCSAPLCAVGSSESVCLSIRLSIGPSLCLSIYMSSWAVRGCSAFNRPSEKQKMHPSRCISPQGALIVRGSADAVCGTL